MAWSGLIQTNIYQTTTLLTSTDRSRISSRIRAEENNDTFGGPLTDGQQTPIGTPCN